MCIALETSSEEPDNTEYFCEEAGVFKSSRGMKFKLNHQVSNVTIIGQYEILKHIEKNKFH